MRMIPAVMDGSNGSNAERKLFNILSALDLGGNCVCFHSLNLTRHAVKRSAEADFTIVHPLGVYTLEVKGGGVRRSPDSSKWIFTSVTGNESVRREGPFDQAHGALMALRRRVEDAFGADFFAGIPLGYGVVMPDCVFSVESVEWESWTIADSRNINQIGSWLRSLMIHWRDQIPGTARDLSSDGVDRLCAFLRPQFDVPTALPAVFAGLDSRSSELTESQMRFMDSLHESERILCRGGAGTGKTFLAARLAQLWADAGERVLIAVHSRWIQSHLKQEIRVPGVTIRTVESLVNRQPRERFRRLIVDEGQDVLNAGDMAVLDRCMDGGWAEGRWAFFCDSNNQATLIGSCEAEATALLEDTRPAKLTLIENCRNTATILTYIQTRTACDMGSRGTGPGPEVTTVSQAEHGGTAEAVEATILRLLNEGVPPGEITVLTAGPPKKSCLADGTIARLSIQVLDEVSVSQRPYRYVTVASVADFKGLENHAIVFCGLEGVEDSRRRAFAYVAMSRARAWLAIIHEGDSFLSNWDPGLPTA